MTTTEQTTVTRATGHGLGIASLVLAIATPVAAVIALIWAGVTPGMGALGVAILGLYAVGTIAVVAVVVGLISLVVSKPNNLAKVSLLLIGATAIVLLMLVFPPSLWFG
ncbi:hypothetical protein LJR045_000346 [Microbacterium sp. LjRoot45]|uniref:hypothetical protein n=1 Tax=Microbacterium sp. LjRoot45 TaxID=3342329 RepID=UPI003ECDB6A3